MHRQQDLNATCQGCHYSMTGDIQVSGILMLEIMRCSGGCVDVTGKAGTRLQSRQLPECICNHMVQTQHSLLCVCWVLEVAQRLGILTPDLLGPEHPSQHSSMDVGLPTSWTGAG